MHDSDAALPQNELVLHYSDGVLSRFDTILSARERISPPKMKDLRKRAATQ